MNALKVILLTILVVTASLAALLIPLTITETVAQTPRATGATISLVDSPPSQAEQPNKEGSTPLPPEPTPEREAPSLISDKGIVPIQTSVEDEIENKQPEKTNTEAPLVDEDRETRPTTSSLDDSPSTEASVVASAVSLAPLPSLIDGYYEATGVDRGPSFNRTALASKITYPPLAKRQGVEGLVMLRLFISVSGKVERIEVEEDPGYGMAQAAVKAFTGLQGEPAILGGKAVPVTLRYPVRFSLN